MSEQVGQLKLQGSMSGPNSSWALTEPKLAKALVEAGAPPDMLRLHVDGGWITVEPQKEIWLQEQVAGGSLAETLGTALELLLQIVPPQCEPGEKSPIEWASTLRLTEFHPQHKLEILFGLTADGLQAVGRESPWRAVPPMTAKDWLQRNWRMSLAIAVAIAATIYLQRDLIRSEWQKLTNPAAIEPAEDGGAEVNPSAQD